MTRDRWPGAFQPTLPPLLYSDSGRASVSAWATVALTLGVVALYATLTGILAPEGLALATVAFLVSLAALATAGRPGATGRGLASLALIFALTGIGLAIIATSHRFSWPNSDTDAIAQWHSWLVTHWPWLGQF